ncbi:MAG: P44/Msp2 family outer membrane protein, partial [Anaplasma sp.]
MQTLKKNARPFYRKIQVGWQGLKPRYRKHIPNPLPFDNYATSTIINWHAHPCPILRFVTSHYLDKQRAGAFRGGERLGGAVGYAVGGARVEVEVGYERFPIKGVKEGA